MALYGQQYAAELGGVAIMFSSSLRQPLISCYPCALMDSCGNIMQHEAHVLS